LRRLAREASPCSHCRLRRSLRLWLWAGGGRRAAASPASAPSPATPNALGGDAPFGLAWLSVGGCSGWLRLAAAWLVRHTSRGTSQVGGAIPGPLRPGAVSCLARSRAWRGLVPGAVSCLARSRAWRGLVAQSLRTGRTKGLEPRRLNRKTRRWAHEDTDACRSLRHHAPFPFPVLALIRVGRTTSRRCSCQHPRLLLYLPHPLAPLIPWRRRSWCPRRRLLRMRRRAAPSSRCRR